MLPQENKTKQNHAKHARKKTRERGHECLLTAYYVPHQEFYIHLSLPKKVPPKNKFFRSVWTRKLGSLHLTAGTLHCLSVPVSVTVLLEPQKIFWGNWVSLPDAYSPWYHPPILLALGSFFMQPKFVWTYFHKILNHLPASIFHLKKFTSVHSAGMGETPIILL